MDRAGWALVVELDDRIGDPAPGSAALCIAGGRELVSASDALLKRHVGVSLQNLRTKVPKLQLTRGSRRVSLPTSARHVISAKMAGDRRFRA